MKLTDDYIRGLVEGEGCFTFCSIPQKGKNGNRFKIPTFVIQMNERDKELIEAIRDYFGLKNKVYICKAYLKDGFKRGKTARLMVRDFGTLRDIIIPFFHNKLLGQKNRQFNEWLSKIGKDPDIYPNYKVLAVIHKNPK